MASARHDNESFALANDGYALAGGPEGVYRSAPGKSAWESLGSPPTNELLLVCVPARRGIRHDLGNVTDIRHERAASDTGVCRQLCVICVTSAMRGHAWKGTIRADNTRHHGG